MATVKHSADAVALGAAMVGQCKGDLAQARRGCEGALAWLCSVDPEFKGSAEVLALQAEVERLRVELAADDRGLSFESQAAAAAIAELRGELADVQASCDRAVAVRDNAMADAAHWASKHAELAKSFDGQAKTIGDLFAQIDAQKVQIAKLQAQSAAPVAQVPAVAPVRTVPDAAFVAPKPIQVQAAPAPVNGADLSDTGPYGHLAPAMRAWAAKRAGVAAA